MAKLNLKAGEKLSMTVRGDSEELSLRTAFVKEEENTLQLSMPMVGGKPYTPGANALMELSWGDESTEYVLSCRATGTVKVGIRTYLVVEHDGEVQRNERRAFTRVPTEMEVEIASFDTMPSGERLRCVYSGRTSDISYGGVAVYTDAPMAVGETVDVSLRRKDAKIPLRAGVCWTRPAPKHVGHRLSAGLQFFFRDSDESLYIAKLVAAAAAKL